MERTEAVRLAHLFRLLDRMMLSKGREPMGDAMKAVWIEELSKTDQRGIEWAVQKIIRSGDQADQWPSVGRIVTLAEQGKKEWFPQTIDLEHERRAMLEGPIVKGEIQ